VIIYKVYELLLIISDLHILIVYLLTLICKFQVHLFEFGFESD
jgi:hypothetical protein